MRKITFIVLFASVYFLFAENDSIPAKNGMVVSASNLASQVGIEIMRAGGNAIDAAVATGFALAVTYPQAGNIGGGGFLVAHLADGRNITLDFRETAPLAAHRDMYLDETGEVIKDMSIRTHRAVAVPGSVAGLLTAWRYYGSGSISIKQLVKPAIKLANGGFKITERFANSLNNNQPLFLKDDSARRVFTRSDGKNWQAGDLLIQKDLSKTLQRIVKNDLNGFYLGKTAELIVAEMESGNGLITLRDLELYSPKLREPIIGNYKNFDIVSMGPPSSGGILLVQMLNMLSNFKLDTLIFNSADYIHLLTEIERLAYADRAEHLGDSDYWKVPITMLIDKQYAADRAHKISMHKAARSTDVFAGEIPKYECRETTHYSVTDKAGNAVSVTTTLNTFFGTGILVDGAGFFLNNEMDDFSAKPGSPNIFGLIGSTANAIQPYKRPLSSMTPTIILCNKKPYIIIGSPGGSTIITTVLQVILNIIEHNMDVQDAVAAPRFHCQWLPDAIFLEPNTLTTDIKSQLESRGHSILPYKWGYIGQANGIQIIDGLFIGGADPRDENSAIGY